MSVVWGRQAAGDDRRLRPGVEAPDLVTRDSASYEMR